MKRTAALFLVLAIIFSVMTPCWALAAEENAPDIEWKLYCYQDADGNATDDMLIANDPFFEGAYIRSENNAYAAYLKVRVDKECMDLTISKDNDTLYEWPADCTFTVNVYASSSLTGSFPAAIKKGGKMIALDDDARDFIVQDMRMLSGETGIEIVPDANMGIFQFILPHDGNFRDLYDAEEARNWSNASAANNAAGASSNSVTPAFKAEIDRYVVYFKTVAEKVQNNDFADGLVGVVDILGFTNEVLNEYDAFKQYGESATTQADKDYYEKALSTVNLTINAGVIGSAIKGLFGTD